MTRGLVASLGASTALVLAGSVALAVVSALVAFNGWPGVGSAEGSLPSSVLADVQPASAPRREAVPVVRLPVVAAGAATPPPAAGAPRARRAARGGIGTARRTRGRGTGADQTPPAAAPSTTAVGAAAPTAPPTAAAARPGDGVRTVGDGAGGAVKQTTKAAGDALTPVVPPAGHAVGDVGQAAGDVVTSATDGVGAAVDGLGKTP